VARRIVVAGVSGNGKTTLSRRLAAKLDLPYIELDAFQHLPGWIQATEEDFLRNVDTATSRSNGWVVDGSYTAALREVLLPRADTVVWLDQSPHVFLPRLLKRTIRDIVTKRDMFNGNRQTIRFAFFVKDSLFAWAIKSHFRRRRTFPKFFAQFPDVELVRLRSPREVERWFEAQQP
jgi:adenylate kinase family enzyme